MTVARSPDTPDASLAGDILYALRYYLGGRRSLIVLGVIIVGAALALNWGWLVAAGIAPLLFAVLPCAAMCALGLCMNRMGGRSRSTDAASTGPTGVSDHKVREMAPDPGQGALPSSPVAAVELYGFPATTDPQRSRAKEEDE
jgi:hypothetical protein